MANQITVNSGTGNITVTTSRSVIGTVANVASANYANFANVANTANTAIALNADIANVSISGGTNGYVLQTDGSGTLTWTAQTGGGGNANAAGSNTQVQFNDAGVFGADANLTFNKTTGVLTAAKVAGNGSALTSITGANVTGTVPSATVAASANSVAGANVTGTVANATFATSAGSANTSNSATVAASANSVAGANVSGTVANATFATSAGSANTANSATVAASANSVAVANVSGIGNIATINLDGNASNVLRGDGTFSAEAGNLNANYANFAGDVVNASQANITSTGNLTTFQVGNGTNDTLRFVPTGSNLVLATANVVVAQNRIASATAPIDAVTLAGNSVGNTYTQQYFAPLGSNVATIGATIYSLDTNANVSNAAAPGSITHRVFTTDSNLANAGTTTALTLNIGSQNGILVTQNMPQSLAGNGVIQTISYGESADQSASTALRFQRRRGNGSAPTARLSVQPNDYLGNIEWRAARSNTQFGTNQAKIAPRVDSGYTANTNPVPIGIEVVVCNTSSPITHNFYSNGNVNFSGAITATNIGNVANTNFNGNGSSVLLGNGVFGSAPVSTPTSIQNGNSVVNFSGAGGDLQIDIDGRQFATFNYGRQLVLTGVSGDYTNASLMKLNNGTMQIINEDLGGGLPSFEFKSYYTTGGSIAPYVFQRARGTFASPANAQTGDAIMNQTFQAYSGSGFVSAGSFGATVTNNDNAGNVRSRVELSTANDNDGSEIKFTTDVITLEGNSAINLNANTTQGSGTLFKLSSYTKTALNAITGSIGQMAAVSDSASGGNPNGMIAFWDTTNSRWSYVHDNSAV